VTSSTVATRGSVRRTIWRVAERSAWIAGAAAIAIWAALSVAGAASARRSVARFVDAQHSPAAAAAPDLSLWSPHRVKAWRDTLAGPAPETLAVLRIPKITLEVPVLEGTADWTLNRAVGHIEDTALPGAPGNVGIAGHRDGFFRGLKDVVAGDTLELETPKGNDRYRIERIWIVQPEDVSVLDPTSSDAITLVTCYPFYFIGSAPQRYIVRAVRVIAATR
jgi:sortase A